MAILKQGKSVRKVTAFQWRCYYYLYAFAREEAVAQQTGDQQKKLHIGQLLTAPDHSRNIFNNFLSNSARELLRALKSP